MQLKLAGTPSFAKDSVQENGLAATTGMRMTRELLNSFKNVKLDTKEDVESKPSGPCRISVLARNYAQVDIVCRMVERGEIDRIDEVIVDFLEVDGMKDAVEKIRRTGRVKAIVASPRVIKPGESGIWRTLLRLEADGLLVRSTGLLHRMMKLGGSGCTVDVEASIATKQQGRTVVIPELIGDFSLNVANPLSAWELLTYGCSRVTASYDLNANGITELLAEMETILEGAASKIEIVAHTHLPIFHTEHCVFARFLSNGNSYLDCGHACTRHSVHLRDQTGSDNLVLGRFHLFVYMLLLEKKLRLMPL